MDMFGAACYECGFVIYLSPSAPKELATIAEDSFEARYAKAVNHSKAQNHVVHCTHCFGTVESGIEYHLKNGVRISGFQMHLNGFRVWIKNTLKRLGVSMYTKALSLKTNYEKQTRIEELLHYRDGYEKKLSGLAHGNGEGIDAYIFALIELKSELESLGVVGFDEGEFKQTTWFKEVS